MDKKLLLAIALSMGILFAWWKIFPPATPQPAVQQPAPAAVEKTAQPAPAAAAVPAQGGAPAMPATRGPEQQISLETADATFVLSSWGATLRGLRLKDPKYTTTAKDGTKAPLQIVRTDRAEWAPLRVTFPRADFAIPEQAAWAVSRPAPDTVVFRTETETVAVEKRYRALPSRYQLQLDVVVENKGAKPISQTLNLHLTGKQDPEKKGGSFLSYAEADVTEMVCFVGDEMHRNNIEDLGKEPKDYAGGVLWMAADEKFFTVAAVAHPETAVERKCGQRGLDGLTGEVFVTLASRTVAAGGKTTYPFTIYGGPKYTSDLEAIDPGGQESHLQEVVNVTFAVLSRPLLYLLRTFHQVAGNWGVAIILLTLFVKLVTFYPTHRTMMSAKKMQKLAPKVAELRKKYETDRQKLGTETMAMYKAHGVSPFGGCLPSLIQMPIWIALFSTLNYAVELHRAPFAFYIHDLSARDPFYITPLLMGVIMFIQMRMSPAGADPQQQKMMAVMMPIMFTFFSLFLPAGLAIYTLTSYLIGILQQLLVNWLDRRATPSTARA